ncbi:MAG: DUF2442 domain-containing protein [bacterium]
MLPRITKVGHIEKYRLELTFTNGEKAELDFRNRIVGRGGVFAPLEDVEFFKQVKVDPDIGTLVWPNEVDFCPDVLYSEATGRPLQVPEIATEGIE